MGIVAHRVIRRCLVKLSSRMFWFIVWVIVWRYVCANVHMVECNSINWHSAKCNFLQCLSVWHSNNLSCIIFVKYTRRDTITTEYHILWFRCHMQNHNSAPYYIQFSIHQRTLLLLLRKSICSNVLTIWIFDFIY